MELTDNNFEELILKSDKLCVVDFFGTWCRPCMQLSPIIDELSTEYENRVVIGKVDVDNNYALTQKYGIRNIPVVLFINNGEVVDKSVGATTKSSLVAKIDGLL